MKPVAVLILLFTAFLCTANAQVYDSSGNGLLHGTYYFRDVLYIVGDFEGDLAEAISAYGNITFDGNGNYTLNATVFDSDAGVPQSATIPGTYVIGANGFGSIDNPITGDPTFGMVSQGIFIGSSTENTYVYNDLFIAAPVASPAATNATLKGSYTATYFDVADGVPADELDATFQMSPDGAGNIGTINISGYVGTLGTSKVNQTLSGIRYSFSNGAANVNFGSSQTSLLYGNAIIYISPDGNFIFGGAPAGWDMFVGVRTSPATAAPALTGTYYQAGIIEDLTQDDLNTYYGAFNANSGILIGHERLLSAFKPNPFDFTYDTPYSLAADGSYDDASLSQHYIVGPGGLVRIGMGNFPILGVSVALQAPTFSGPAPYINPVGIVNAASSAPFSVGISRGELITIYGSGLAKGTVIASTVPFPPMLGGVTVTINGRQAPIYYVSDSQISVLVPYATEVPSTAQIQVNNNGALSNVITEFTNLTTPGVFTTPAGGVGRAAALHPDFSLVSPAAPAQIGETIAVFVTGLGDVTPTVSDGAAGPSDPLSKVTNPITVFIDGQEATVTYSGLAPQLAGLYQLNVTVPTGVSSGDVFIDVSGPDSYNSEALLPVGSGVLAGTALRHGSLKPRSTRSRVFSSENTPRRLAIRPH